MAGAIPRTSSSSAISENRAFHRARKHEIAVLNPESARTTKQIGYLPRKWYGMLNAHLMRPSGMVHRVRSSFSSDQTAPRISPDRTAVRIAPLQRKRAGAGGLSSETLKEFYHLGMGQRPELSLLLELSRQPLRDRAHRRFAVAQSVSVTSIEHCTDPLAHPADGLGDLKPYLRQHVADQRAVDLVDLHLAEQRIGIEFKCLDLLPGVFAVFPTLHPFGMGLFDRLLER